MGEWDGGVGLNPKNECLRTCPKYPLGDGSRVFNVRVGLGPCRYSAGGSIPSIVRPSLIGLGRWPSSSWMPTDWLFRPTSRSTDTSGRAEIPGRLITRYHAARYTATPPGTYASRSLPVWHTRIQHADAEATAARAPDCVGCRAPARLGLAACVAAGVWRKGC